MPATPLVSVVIPAYNAAIYLDEAIRSVVCQRFRDLEVVVIDDGSTDETKNVVARYASDPRVQYEYQDNRGLSSARNAGILKSRGKYIALLDADDVWLSGKLERQVAVLESEPGVDVVYCQFQCIDAAGTPFPQDCSWVLKRTQPTLYEELMYRNVVAGSGSSVLLRASCFRDVGLFDENLPASEDQDMWRRLALRHKFYFLQDEVLVCIRVHAASMQANLERVTLGRMRHLAKMREDTPPAFRHHLPHVAHNAYLELARAHYESRRFLRTLFFLAKIARLGPGHSIGLLRELRLLLWHRWQRHHPRAEVEK